MYVLAEIITDFIIGVGLLRAGGTQAVEGEQDSASKSGPFNREGEYSSLSLCIASLFLH